MNEEFIKSRFNRDTEIQSNVSERFLRFLEDFSKKFPDSKVVNVYEHRIKPDYVGFDVSKGDDFSAVSTIDKEGTVYTQTMNTLTYGGRRSGKTSWFKRNLLNDNTNVNGELMINHGIASRSLRVHTVEPEFRGQFSRDTLDLLCLQPQHCEGDEYILINGKLWELQVLLNHGWVYCELKKYPRLLIKSGDNEDA